MTELLSGPRRLHPISMVDNAVKAAPGALIGMVGAIGVLIQRNPGLAVLIALGILGDGDFMMSSGALWTAVHYKVPLLVIINNNLSWYNDEEHQVEVAKMRGRPPENAWIGTTMRRARNTPASTANTIAASST